MFLVKRSYMQESHNTAILIALGGAKDADLTREHLDELRDVLANDLDTPAAIDVVDGWVASGRPAAAVLVDAVDALLGLRLRS